MRNWRRKNREQVLLLKASGCIDCGETHPATLDFHHRDPSEKKATIARLLSVSSITTIQTEIAKCDLLCSNCHRKRHYAERHNG